MRKVVPSGFCHTPVRAASMACRLRSAPHAEIYDDLFASMSAHANALARQLEFDETTSAQAEAEWQEAQARVADELNARLVKAGAGIYVSPVQ
jgi:hypothetical protein